MFDGTLLLCYYHKIIFDLALSFKRLFKKVEICVSSNLKDNYGTEQNVIKKGKSLGFDVHLLPVALANLKAKKYCLVGCDGVFQGDQLLMDVCRQSNVPFFCIDGYPFKLDEPSQNILSFSWGLPQAQYREKYPHEPHVKDWDWKNIAQTGRSEGKNICVYYPEMNELKEWRHKVDWEKIPDAYGFISLIHRFEECNKWNYEVFNKVKKQFNLENYTNLTQEELWNKLILSKGLIHLKSADRPGIAVLEAMLLDCVPIVMKSFVLASQNQDLLIDDISAIVCDSVDELIDRVKKLETDKDYINNCDIHAGLMTDWDRQKNKVEKFFERCLNV